MIHLADQSAPPGFQNRAGPGAPAHHLPVLNDHTPDRKLPLFKGFFRLIQSDPHKGFIIRHICFDSI
jgi:hypothetical protein